jgi:hypothetical protein
MAEEKVHIQLSPAAPPVEAVNVDVLESKETWNEIVLSDGAKLRVKTIIVSVARIDSLRDAEGNPVYFIKSQPVIGIVKPPEAQNR